MHAVHLAIDVSCFSTLVHGTFAAPIVSISTYRTCALVFYCRTTLALIQHLNFNAFSTLAMAPPQNGEIIADSDTTTSAKDSPRLTSFPAANDDYRYLRKRASILCAAFSAQPLDVSDTQRTRAWNEYVTFFPPSV